MLVALAASHGYMIVRVLIRHVLERLLWKGSKEEQEAERQETVVKVEYLKSLGVADVREEKSDLAAKVGGVETREEEVSDGVKAFWEFDEGLDEIQRVLKDA